MGIQKIRAKSWFKCVSCREQVRTDEFYFQGDSKPVKRERYCLGCEKIANLNNPDDNQENDGESHLRSMEDYAAYRANGCTSEYWNDRDNGYCS